MNRINNKGFVMIETIIVMSILAIGLISLYASYSLIMKRTQNLTNDSSINTYMAYQINNYIFYEDTNQLTSTYFVEVSKNKNGYIRNECGILSSEKKCVPSTIVSEEEQELYNNLNINKIYYFTKPLKDIFSNNIILLFDGSTIEYLNKIKNDINVDASAERTVIVKTKNHNNIEFSYYQKRLSNEYKNIRKAILGENRENIEQASTNIGKQTTDANYSTIESVIDDYGISYYFRGNPSNNYIIFANMCWRIVRINGNGSIKLVLFNGDNNIASCNVSDNAAFAKYANNTYVTKFNNNANNNTYIGYMYSSTPSANSYTLVHSNILNSQILTNLKTWYDNKFNTLDKEKIVDTIWCNDKRVVNDNTYNSFSLDNITNNGIGTSVTYYQTSKRLNPKNNAEPSLVCGGNDNLLSKYTAGTSIYGNGSLSNYKIGLLTADEIAIAGSVADNTGSATTNYLYQNAGMDYWTISPAYFNGNKAFMWIVNEYGILNTTSVDSDNIAIRPSISISSNVNIIGDGTIDNPYIVVD